MASEKHVPSVIWAQRADKLYVTICVDDCKNAVVNFENDKLTFSGTGGPDRVDYELTLTFFGEIDPSQSKYAALSRHIPMIIRKKESTNYWPRLLKEARKVHWLKTDFEKWRDESDSDVDESKDQDFEDMMKKMGNFNASSASDEVPVEEDSDDDDLPDLE
jgi:prostaglandin-E synthase